MKLSSNSNFKFISFYLVIVFVNYFMPEIIRVLFFTLLLVFFYRSKDNSFWIALFFLIQLAPAYLFNQIDPVYNLAFYKIPASDRNITFNELVIVVMFLKSLTSKREYFLNRIIILVMVYSLFLFFMSFAFGISGTKVLRTIRFLFPLTLFWSIPSLLLTKEKFLEVFNYFLVFSIIVFLLQIYMFIKGQHFFMLLGGQFEQRFEVANDQVFNSEEDLMRPLYSTHILFLNIITGLYYYITSSKQSPKHLSIYFTLSLISLVITGTRGYSVGAVIMVVLYVVFIPVKFKAVSKYIVFALITLSLLIFIPSVRHQMSMAMERISTVRLFAEGDITAGGTAQRFSKYMPVVMNKFSESPVFGFGFSDEFYSNTNAHVAIPNLMLNGGIVGLLIFTLLVLYYYYRSVYLYVHFSSVYIIVFIGLTGFLIVHSFSFAVFSFLIGQANYACFILFLCFSDVLFNNKISFLSGIFSKGRYPAVLKNG